MVWDENKSRWKCLSNNKNKPDEIPTDKLYPCFERLEI